MAEFDLEAAIAKNMAFKDQARQELIAIGIHVERVDSWMEHINNYTWSGAKKECRDHDCFYCGEYVGQSEADHVIPRAQGGPDLPWNLVPACHRCNMAKLDGRPTQFKQFCIDEGYGWPLKTKFTVIMEEGAKAFKVEYDRGFNDAMEMMGYV